MFRLLLHIKAFYINIYASNDIPLIVTFGDLNHTGSLDLAGKIALITGASAGRGYEQLEQGGEAGKALTTHQSSLPLPPTLHNSYGQKLLSGI